MTPSGTEQLVDVTMPQMGVSVVEGMVVAWRKRIGDEVEADETICDVVTDKIDTEVPAPVPGVVREILVETDVTVEVGTVIARIGCDSAVASALAGAGTGDAEAPPLGAVLGSTSPEIEDGSVRGDRGRDEGDSRISPVVRRLAAEHGVDLATVRATGRNGRVTKEDVLRRIEEAGADAPAKPSPPLPAGATEVPLSAMRRAIGRHMATSVRTAPHCTTIVEADVTGLEGERRRRGSTALPIVARDVLDTLAEFPALNAWMKDDETLVLHERIHLGVAVSLGDAGLVVPVIHDAHELAVEQLGERIGELAERARAGALSHDDVSGATFTVSNPGAFGAMVATPIINQPQVAILDTEAVARRPVVVVDADGNETVAIRSMIHLCMSWDHRAIDGVYAARFLTALRGRLERRG